jgi:hypothetical protein
MIAFGVIFGRWWRWSIVAGGVVWVLILLAPPHSMAGSSGAVWTGAFLLGIANTAVGVALFLLARLVLRASRLVLHPAAKR